MKPSSLPLTARLPIALALSSLLLGMAFSSHASHIGEDLTVDQQTVASTDQLLSALRQFEAMPPAVQQARIAQMVQLAAQRKQRLLRLLERNPKLAASRLLSAGLRDRLPAEARLYVEEDVSLSGSVFAAVGDDFVRGISKSEFKLQTSPSAPVLTLRLADANGGERDMLGWAGRRVSVNGARLDGNLIIRDKRQVLVAADGTTTTGNVTPTTTPLVKGDQKTLVILANFSDKALACSQADVSNRVFGSTGATVNTGFIESSRNAVTFSGQAVGPVSIPYTSTGACDYSGWAAAADAAARAAGFDPALYQRVSYVTPSNSTCGWSGLAYMPGRQSWVQSCGSTGVYTHELGHNLSLHHSSTPTSEYGDASDPMGGARTVRNNAANQVMAGWVPTGGVLDVFSGGSYALSALGPTTITSPQVLRMIKLDTNESYYVSLRQASGLDASLPSSFVNTLSIHRSTGKLPAKTVLLQNLALGQTFTDAVNGIQVTHQGVSLDTATVAVAFTGSACVRNAPTLSINPASQTSAPGGSVSYSATVLNTSTAACGTTSFNMTQTLPTGITGTLSASSVALAAGASASLSLTAKSATGTSGTYTLDLTATDPAGPQAATAHASYVVFADTVAPTVALTSPTTNGQLISGRSFTLGANASDASGIASVEFWDGNTLIATDTAAPFSANWNLRRVTKGVHVLKAKATDKAGNISFSALTSVTVQ